MGFEIDNLMHVSYLVRYALLFGDEAVAKDVSSTVAYWSQDMSAFDVRGLVAEVREGLVGHEDRESWWSNLLALEDVEDYVPREMTHWDVEKMARDMAMYGGDVIPVDDPLARTFGFESEDGTRQWVIGLASVKQSAWGGRFLMAKMDMLNGSPAKKFLELLEKL